MILSLSKNELEKCQKLLDAKESNISAAEIYIDYLTNHFDEISKTDMDCLTRKYDINTSFYKAFLKKLSISEKDEEYFKINRDCEISNQTCLNKEDFINDSYYKTIGTIKAIDQDLEFRTLKYLAYEGFVSDELEINQEYFQEHTPISFFKEEFPYLALIQNNEIWMSLIPHEINTMKKPIKEAKGRVLVLGLGLGYYLFHIASKKDVTSIDVIEKDPRIAGLFNKYLLDKFPNKEKISIIIDDAISYLDCEKQYDYIFCDVYHNVGDGEKLYLQIKSKENNRKNTIFSYWIETSILAMLRRQVLTVFEEALEGYKETDYLKFENENDKIINSIYFLTKNYVIDSFESLHVLLKDESLKELAKNIWKE